MRRKCLFLMAFSLLFSHSICLKPLDLNLNAEGRTNVRSAHLKTVDALGLIYEHLKFRSLHKWCKIECSFRGGSANNASTQAVESGPPSDTIYVTGLPKFANEDWIAMLFGFDKVKVDKETGAREVFVYRDEAGVPTGAALVGLASVEEALRAQRECDGQRLWGSAAAVAVRVVARKAGAAAGAAGEVPLGWQQFADSESGRAYFHHPASGRTQWERPTGREGEEDVERAAAEGAGREGRWSRTGRLIGPDMYADASPRRAGPEIPGQRCLLSEEEALRPRPTPPGPLPRGCPEDLKLVNRRKHEAAAVVAPEYGDEGFVHCIGPCQCRCRRACPGLCACPRCEVYPGTCWPMHPEILRLRRLGVPRSPHVYNRLKPPPGYIAGVGRGAKGIDDYDLPAECRDDFAAALRRMNAHRRARRPSRRRSDNPPGPAGPHDARRFADAPEPPQAGAARDRGLGSRDEDAWEGQEGLQDMAELIGSDGLLHV